MTFEEMQHSMKEVRDNQVVQGQLLHRVETNLDRLEEKLDRLEGMVEQNSQAIGKLADGAVLMQSAMKGLITTVDRFIRGMEGNGRHRSEDKPQ